MEIPVQEVGLKRCNEIVQNHDADIGIILPRELCGRPDRNISKCDRDYEGPLQFSTDAQEIQCFSYMAWPQHQAKIIVEGRFLRSVGFFLFFVSTEMILKLLLL